MQANIKFVASRKKKYYFDFRDALMHTIFEKIQAWKSKKDDEKDAAILNFQASMDLLQQAGMPGLEFNRLYRAYIDLMISNLTSNDRRNEWQSTFPSQKQVYEITHYGFLSQIQRTIEKHSGIIGVISLIASSAS